MENDYIKYEDICRMLKRYSFEEKMRICNYYSRDIMNVNGDVDATQIISKVYPWELETFLLMSIKATPEYNNGNFIGKNEKIFVKMINGIRNYESPKLSKYEGKEIFVQLLMSAYGLLQFDIQEASHYKMYRYSYFFDFVNDKIDMKSEFKKFYGIEYNEFLKLGTYLILLYGSKLTLNSTLLEFLVHNIFPIPYKNLVISLEEYKKQLDSITQDIGDYSSCLRPSYKYPFIVNENKVYLPLPHLISRAITSSLLYRLTEKNAKLRDLFGKEILEKYLFKILSEAGVYDEIYPEKKFVMEHHNTAKTLDVMMKQGGEYLLIDSKAAVPSIGTRIYEIDAYEKEIEKLAKHVVQVYKHLRIFLYTYESYNPYLGKPEIAVDNLWGMAVVLEDNFVSRKLVYEKAADELEISLDSEDYQWICNHIKVTNLYDIERYTFKGSSLIDEMKNKMKEGRPYDYPLSNQVENLKREINRDYLQFVEKIKNNFKDITEILVENDII